MLSTVISFIIVLVLAIMLICGLTLGIAFLVALASYGIPLIFLYWILKQLINL